MKCRCLVSGRVLYSAGNKPVALPMRITLKHSTSKAQARLFFAVRPNDETRERLARVQMTFDVGTARAVAPDNFHLTLAFLGEMSADKRECYAQAAGTVEIPTFSVTLDRFGYFDKRPLCWIGPSAIPIELRTLHKRLVHAITPCGYRDRREFKPHVTLFRKAAGITPPDETPAVELRVDRFFLVESVQKDDSVVYVPIEEYRN